MTSLLHLQLCIIALVVQFCGTASYDCYDVRANSEIPNATYVTVKTTEGAKYCVHICTHSKFIFTFECKAVMVNYARGECMLSTMNHQDKAVVYSAGTELYEKTCDPTKLPVTTPATPARYPSQTYTNTRYNQQRYSVVSFTTPAPYTARSTPAPYTYTTRPYTYPTRPYTYTTRPYTYTTRPPYTYTTRPYTYTTRPYTYTTRPTPAAYTTAPNPPPIKPYKPFPAPIPISRMSLGELINMENKESIETDSDEDDDYDDEITKTNSPKRYVKRSPQTITVLDGSSAILKPTLRATRTRSTDVNDFYARAPVARPLRPLIVNSDDFEEVAKIPPKTAGRSITPAPRRDVSIVPKAAEEKLIGGCFVQKMAKKLLNYEQKSLIVASVDACRWRCLSENSFLCLSVNFDSLTKFCTLNGGSATLNQAVLADSPKSVYLENKCTSKKSGFKKDLFNDTTAVSRYVSKLRECFRIRQDAVLFELNGFIVEEADSLSDCLLACGQSRALYKTACVSVNWFKETHQCYIHSVGSETKQLQKSKVSDFYKNICAANDFVSDDGPTRTANTDYDSFVE